MPAIEAEKEKFLRDVVPVWDAQARERESKLPAHDRTQSNY